MKPLRRLLIGLSLTAAALTAPLAFATTASADTATDTATVTAPVDDETVSAPTRATAVPLDTWWG